MNNNKEMKYDLSDISLVPSVLSNIESRKEINIYNNYNNTSLASLPIMVSPMCSVITSKNWRDYLLEGLFPCLPRGDYVDSPLVINSISLQDFEKHIAFLKSGIETRKYEYLLIDIAHGGIKKLYELTKEFMSLNTKTNLIIGNIANSGTYELYAKLGIWGCRISVGSGSACLTAVQTAVFYPLGSLIGECYQIKKSGDYQTKIIGDGGFKDYSSILKGLAMGCDFIMLGGVLNKCLESSGDTFLFGIKINSIKDIVWNFKSLRKYMTKDFYGMSTKHVQKKWGKSEIKTSEGIRKRNKVEYNLKGWVANFKDYLKSSMSYTNSLNLEEYKDCDKIFISQNSINRFLK